MKKLPIYISLLLLITCSKDNPDTIDNSTPDTILPKYTLIASAGDGGSVTGGGTFSSGTQVSVTATPNSGYSFSGWSNGSTSNPVTLSITSNTSITANFLLIPIYNIQLNAEEGGSVTGSGEYQEGSQLTITAIPDDGYEFSGWSDGNSELNRTIEVVDDLSLTASFTELITYFTLTFDSQDGGSVSSTGGEYNEGTEITVTATPENGFIFTGWSNGLTEQTITITADQNIDLIAQFELLKYTLTISALEGGFVSTSGGEFPAGTDVSVIATPQGCYEFSGWSDGDTNPERTINISSDQTIVANFESLVNETEYSLVKMRYPCAYFINADKPYNETNKYLIGPAGWLSVSVQEQYGEYYYPTENDYNPPGYFVIDPHNMSHGDFNDDGLQDVLVTWATFTHTLERESRLNYSVLLNNGDGSMSIDNNAFTSNSVHNNHFAYRTIVEDFNNDGYDDIVSASMGVIQRLPGQDPYTRWEKIPLLFNTGDGQFYDASSNIEGQEDGSSPPEGHTFGHELAVGDVDGDGDIDIFTGKILLINDGSGNFSNKTDLLISELKPVGRNIWSSVIADFNNDGIEDFFVPYAESSTSLYSGVFSISKDGNPSYNNSTKGFVSDAKYGIGNTKFNYAIDYDINLDGYKDIVIGVTRASPYYTGKGLQIFLNVEDTETGSRKFISGDNLLPDESVLDQYHGEGQLSIIDINNDGILDIAHTSGSYTEAYGLSFYLNNGGSLELVSLDNLAYLNSEQIPERAEWPNDGRTLGRAFPVDLNGSGWIDYISILSLGQLNQPTEIVFYSALSKD